MIEWGCILRNVPRILSKTEGKVNHNSFCKILEQKVTQYMDFYDKNVKDIVFQQKNDPIYTYKSAKK